MTPEQAFLQARFAREVALTAVLIDQAALLEVVVIRISCTQHELDIKVLVTFLAHKALLANRSTLRLMARTVIVFDCLTWAACVTSNLLDSLQALDFDEAAGS